MGILYFFLKWLVALLQWMTSATLCSWSCKSKAKAGQAILSSSLNPSKDKKVTVIDEKASSVASVSQVKDVTSQPSGTQRESSVLNGENTQSTAPSLVVGLASTPGQSSGDATPLPSAPTVASNPPLATPNHTPSTPSVPSPPNQALPAKQPLSPNAPLSSGLSEKLKELVVLDKCGISQDLLIENDVFFILDCRKCAKCKTKDHYAAHQSCMHRSILEAIIKKYQSRKAKLTTKPRLKCGCKHSDIQFVDTNLEGPKKQKITEITEGQLLKNGAMVECIIDWNHETISVDGLFLFRPTLGEKMKGATSKASVTLKKMRQNFKNNALVSKLKKIANLKSLTSDERAVEENQDMVDGPSTTLITPIQDPEVFIAQFDIWLNKIETLEALSSEEQDLLCAYANKYANILVGALEEESPDEHATASNYLNQELGFLNDSHTDEEWLSLCQEIARKEKR